MARAAAEAPPPPTTPGWGNNCGKQRGACELGLLPVQMGGSLPGPFWGKLAKFLGDCEAKGRRPAALRTSAMVLIPQPSLLLPLVYRIWVLARRPPVRQWARGPSADGEEPPGKGADKAAWHLALEAECLGTDPGVAEEEDALCWVFWAAAHATSGPCLRSSTPGRPVAGPQPADVLGAPARPCRLGGDGGQARHGRRHGRLRLGDGPPAGPPPVACTCGGRSRIGGAAGAAVSAVRRRLVALGPRRAWVGGSGGQAGF